MSLRSSGQPDIRDSVSEHYRLAQSTPRRISGEPSCRIGGWRQFWRVNDDAESDGNWFGGCGNIAYCGSARSRYQGCPHRVVFVRTIYGQLNIRHRTPFSRRWSRRAWSRCKAPDEIVRRRRGRSLPNYRNRRLDDRFSDLRNRGYGGRDWLRCARLPRLALRHSWEEGVKKEQTGEKYRRKYPQDPRTAGELPIQQGTQEKVRDRNRASQPVNRHALLASEDTTSTSPVHRFFA
jgi:hypothetical protein